MSKPPKMPRITMSLSESDQAILKRKVEVLDLSSPGQLMRMLLSGDAKKIDWIVEELKKPDRMF